MSFVSSYRHTASPLKKKLTMRAAVRSLSPFPRRRKADLMKNAEINFHPRKRSSFEDPGLLETSAIEVVLESPPSTPRKSRPPKEEPTTPDVMASSTSSEHSAEKWVNQDMKRKSFKQKFIVKKKGNLGSPKGLTVISPKETPRMITDGSLSTKSPSREGMEDEDFRNPLESRRCFPFSVHASLSEKSRGRPPSRSGVSSKTESDSSQEKVIPGKVSTPLRRRARSLSRRRGAPTPTSKASPKPGPFRKTTTEAKTPLMQSLARSSTEDNHLGDELPDPMIEERLVMRPRLLERLEGHGPPPAALAAAPPSPRRQPAPKTPEQITLGRQKSMYSEVSTPSALKSQHPVVQRMEESILDATKSGKKIDRKLVYQTLLKIADSLESPEEQAAMQREVALLLQQESPPTPPPPPPAPKITVVPQDTFSPELSENLGPAFTPPRKQDKVSRVASRVSRAVSRVRKGNGEDGSSDGFVDWNDEEEWESRSSDSRTSTDNDTVDFLTDMFSFGSFYFTKGKGTRARDVRDDEDEGETEDEPESWNKFQPPPGVVNNPTTRRMPRIRSRGVRRKNAFQEIHDGDSDNEDSPKQSGSPWRTKKLPKDRNALQERRAWWRKKADEGQDMHGVNRERSLLPSDDVLSLSSIESQQYRTTPHRRERDVSPDAFYPHVEEYAIPRRRSKSLEDRRRMHV